MSEAYLYQRFSCTKDALHRCIGIMKPHWGRAIWLALLDASAWGDYTAMRNIVARCDPSPTLNYFLALLTDAEQYAAALGY